jgi:two-component system NarL family sensor kinase
MGSKHLSLVWHYLIAILVPLAIGGLWPSLVGLNPVTVSPFFLAIAVVARFFGFGPALACTQVSTLPLWKIVFHVEPQPLSSQVVCLLLFLAASVVLASISRQRSREVRDAEERYRSIVELSPDGIGVVDERGRILFANQALARILGAEHAGELVGREPLEFIHRDFLGPARERMTDLLAGRSLPTIEETWVRRDGTTVEVEVAAVPIRRHRKISGQGFVRDITERKEAQRSLQQLSARLLRLQDEDRQRIARQLHDTTAQNLLAVSLNLARIARSPAVADAVIQEAVAESAALTDQSLDEIRTLSFLLHPPMIDEAGLQASLEWYLHGFTERSGIVATLDAPQDLGRLGRETEIAVFRIVQEGLTNIQRHSGSTVARVGLRRDPQRVQLELEDQGRGMPPELRDHPGALLASGFGLAGIRQRVQGLGGHLEIQSGNRGTRLVVSLPVAAT